MSTIRDIMTRTVKTVADETSVRDLVDFLHRERVSGAPVRGSTGEILGVVSSTDVMSALSEREVRPSAQLESESAVTEASQGPFYYPTWSGEEIVERLRELLVGHASIETLRVRDIMTPEVLALPPTASLHEAARYMVERGIHRVLVMEGARLVGLASTLDVLRGLSAEEP